MVEFLIVAGLSVLPAEVGPSPSEASSQQEQAAAPGKAQSWTLPRLNYGDDGCEQFMQRPLDGFGNLKVGTPCPARPAETASKGRSPDKRN